MLWVDSTAPNYEGKGAVAGRICRDLAERGQQVIGVRIGGPNAGHTVLGRCPADCGDAGAHGAGPRPAHPWRLRQVPVSVVTAPGSWAVIAAGSEVDQRVLEREIVELDSAGYNASGRLAVDRSATILHDGNILEEQALELQASIGSTAKGIGSARAARIWRMASTWGQATGGGWDTAAELRARLYEDDVAVVVEGTQGYGLGLHTENYPRVTSGDCRAVDFLAQAGVSPWQQGVGLRVLVCLRPYPIRVAGNSGPMKDETTWEALGLPAEHTTVTQKVRRVGAWDPELARAAMLANGGPSRGVVWAALTMMDSVDPELAGADGHVPAWSESTAPKCTRDYLHSFGWNAGHLAYVGTGPDTALVNERIYR